MRYQFRNNNGLRRYFKPNKSHIHKIKSAIILKTKKKVLWYNKEIITLK